LPTLILNIVTALKTETYEKERNSRLTYGITLLNKSFFKADEYSLRNMSKLIRSCRLIAFSTFVVLLSVLIPGCESRYENLDLRVYQYRDTKDLVKYVYDASLIVSKNGLNSLDYFRKTRQLHNTPDRYLYIYDMNGVNIYHAGMPQLEGRNLWDITDKNGKKAVQMVIAALADKNNPHAWVHYS